MPDHDSHHFDAMGGEMTTATHETKVWLVIQEAPTRMGSRQQAHILDRDDCVSLAHDLIRRAYRMGDPRPEVMAALGALANLADREDAEALRGTSMMGEQ